MARRARGSRRAARLAAEEARSLAQSLIAVAEGLAVSVVGEEGRFLPHERMLLETGLPALLSRLRLRALEAVGGIAAPAAVVAALVSWGLRVATAASRRAREKPVSSSQGQEEESLASAARDGDLADLAFGGNEWLWRNVRSI